jgi:hypothetical protein
MMDSELLRLAAASLRAEIRERYRVDPLSRTFLFDRKFAQARSRVALLGGSVRRTALSLFLHEAMTDKARAEVFPGAFDLGNHRVLADRECSYAELARELAQESDYSRKVDPLEAFETIKDWVSNFIGQKLDLRSRRDKATVLKVVKLFYWVVRERKAKFFPLIEAPEQAAKAGLEFREAYPNAKNEELTWLVADLKEYLGAELTKEKITEIGDLFGELMPLIDETLRTVEQLMVVAGRSQYSFVVSAYAMLVKRIECLHCDRPRLDNLQLDEELYIYLSSLEYRHYAQTHPSLMEVAEPKIEIRAITDALRRLAESIAPRGIENVREHSRLIWLKHFEDFADDRSQDIRGMMAEAMRIPIDEKIYAEAIPHAKKLLERVFVFDANRGIDVSGVELSPLESVAALCSVYHEALNRTNHEPYWYGQKTPRASLLESLDIPLSDDVLEEHSQIWRHRFRWFRMAIGGHLEWHDQKMALRTVLIKKVAEIARMNNVELMSRNLGELVGYVKRSCFEVLRSES